MYVLLGPGRGVAIMNCTLMNRGLEHIFGKVWLLLIFMVGRVAHSAQNLRHKLKRVVLGSFRAPADQMLMNVIAGTATGQTLQHLRDDDIQRVGFLAGIGFP